MCVDGDAPPGEDRVLQSNRRRFDCRDDEDADAAGVSGAGSAPGTECG